MLTPPLDKNRDGSLVDDVTSMIGASSARRNHRRHVREEA
jgi:hypothetical protein